MHILIDYDFNYDDNYDWNFEKNVYFSADRWLLVGRTGAYRTIDEHLIRALRTCSRLMNSIKLELYYRMAIGLAAE